VSRTRIIAAAPQAVWDVLADFGSISSWAASVDHSCVLEHGADGSPLGTSRRVQVGRNTLVERITEFSAPSVLGYDIEGLPRRLRRLANRWEVRPAGDGRTEVTLISTVEIGDNLLSRAAENIVCRAMAKQSDSMLTGLADEVEDSP
jgi:uncharacterized protein YndB with AHSA1/START domain